MEDFADTHLCLTCQTTVIGLDNYVLHKNNSCSAGKQGSGSTKSNTVHGIVVSSSTENSLLTTHNYQQQKISQPDVGTQPYGHRLQPPHSHSLQAQSAHSHNLQAQTASTHPHDLQLQAASSHPHNLQAQSHSLQTEATSTHAGASDYLSLPTCQPGPVLGGQNTILSTSHHESTPYLHSASHLPLNASNHSISTLIADHSSTAAFHPTSHQLHELASIEPSAHSLSPNLTPGSSQKLPSFRTFRSSSRLLPNITREPPPIIETSTDALHPLMPFSHHFNVHRDPLTTGDHLDGLPASSTNLSLGVSTSQFTSSVLTSPYTTATHTQSTSQSSGLNVEVSDSAVVSFVNTLSPTTSRVVDPNMVLYDGLPDKDTTFTDFFSSLELQYRVESDGTRPLGDTLHKSSPSADHDHLKMGGDGKLDIDHNKALHIANIINELAFSSDSDNILPSDTENLFDTSVDDENDDVHGDCVNNPPPSHTGGKWIPGQKPVTPKYDSASGIPDTWISSGKGKFIHNKPMPSSSKSSIAATNKVLPGKIKTGLGKGKSMGGKFKGGICQKRIERYDSEEEDKDKGELTDDEYDDDEGDHHPARGKYVSKGKVFPSGKFMPVDKTYFCKPCQRTLLNKVSYERHCSTTTHIQKAKELDESVETIIKEVKDVRSKTGEVESIECTVCDITFNNRYRFARHLVSANHQRKALTDHKVMLLEEPYQILLSRQSRFQCHMCQFYCNTSEQLNLHVYSTAHTDKTDSLVGPQLCVRCKFASWSNAEMLDHIEGDQHIKTIADSELPCVLRESRYRVQCRSCDNIFHSATSLKKHVETIHRENVLHEGLRKRKQNRGKGPPICQYCQKKWPSFASMELHIRRKHTFEKPFICQECNRRFTDQAALNIHNQSRRHLNRLVQLGDVRPVGNVPKQKKSTPTKVTHKCKLCDYVADKYTDLRPHFLQNHVESVLECTTCGVKFVSESAYKNHMNSRTHIRTEEEANKSTTSFTCSVCGKKFYHCKKFVLHKIVHRNVQSKNESVRKVCMFDTGIADKHQQFLDSIKNVKPSHKVMCPICHRNIAKLQIYTHLRIHESVTPFGCIFCVKCFACPKSLQRHLAGHLGIKYHACSVCQKKFSRERLLAVHMKTEHSGAKKTFKCCLCTASFAHKWRLRIHLLSHVKPVPCKEEGCLMRFKTESAMLTHYHTHTGDRPFLCDQCGYAGSTKQHLNRHRRTHSGERHYQCEYCEYRAINSTNLSRHMRIHIGTKPFKCPYCNFTCNTLDNIRKHIMKTKKHIGKQVYMCKACNAYGTNSAGDFKDHLIRVHNVTEQSINVLSEYAGLYNKEEDVKTLPEGARVIPVKDRQSSKEGSVKRKNSLKASSTDHEYSANTTKRAKKARAKSIND